MTRAIVFITLVAGVGVLIAMAILRRSSGHQPSPAEVESMTPPAPEMSPPPPPSEEPVAGRLRYLLLLIPASLLVAALIILTAGSGSNDGGTSAVSTNASPTATARASVAGGSSAVAADATATAMPHPVDVARVVVPSLDINAPIITLGVDATGTMEAPGNPTDVAWYNFSARPGEIGNVVLAGHLDYINYGPAVFYHLKDAKAGDEVDLVLVDGTTARYRIQNVTTYDDATAPVQEIVGPTDKEVVTLITCGGSFDQLSREYDKRVVLRAERVADTAVAP